MARQVSVVRDQRRGGAVVLVTQEMELAAGWAAELEELLLRVGQRFSLDPPRDF